MNLHLLKENMHREIDAMQDEIALQLLHDAAVDYNQLKPRDIVDILSAEQKSRLSQSIKQAEEGNTISHEDAKQLVSKWRTK